MNIQIDITQGKSAAYKNIVQYFDWYFGVDSQWLNEREIILILSDSGYYDFVFSNKELDFKLEQAISVKLQRILDGKDYSMEDFIYNIIRRETKYWSGLKNLKQSLKKAEYEAERKSVAKKEEREMANFTKKLKSDGFKIVKINKEKK